jgi:hypothetical protein
MKYIVVFLLSYIFVFLLLITISFSIIAYSKNIENYDNLPENVIFIHDEDESWHHDGKITDNIYKWIDEYERGGRK